MGGGVQARVRGEVKSRRLGRRGGTRRCGQMQRSKADGEGREGREGVWARLQKKRGDEDGEGARRGHGVAWHGRVPRITGPSPWKRTRDGWRRDHAKVWDCVWGGFAWYMRAPWMQTRITVVRPTIRWCLMYLPSPAHPPHGHPATTPWLDTRRSAITAAAAPPAAAPARVVRARPH